MTISLGYTLEIERKIWKCGIQKYKIIRIVNFRDKKTYLKYTILNGSNALYANFSVRKEICADCDVESDLRFEKTILRTSLSWKSQGRINLQLLRSYYIIIVKH